MITAEPINLSALAHQCREAMAHGWPVELRLRGTGSVSGRITRILQNQETRADVLKAKPNTRSHLRVEINGHMVDLERVTAVRPRL